MLVKFNKKLVDLEAKRVSAVTGYCVGFHPGLSSNSADALRKLVESVMERAVELYKASVQPGDISVIGTNTGHGHVWPRPDGFRSRCGGPRMCSVCASDKAFYDVTMTKDSPGTRLVEAAVCVDHLPEIKTYFCTEGDYTKGEVSASFEVPVKKVSVEDDDSIRVDINYWPSWQDSNPPSVEIKPMRAGGEVDNYVIVTVQDRSVAVHHYKELWKARYDVDYWKWVFFGGIEPNILDYEPDNRPLGTSGT